MTKKISLSVIFILGLMFILTPGPGSVGDFPPIPDSLKSSEPGDTTQVPDIAAYFSDFDRAKITNYYKKAYQDKFWFGKIIPPIRINHPPEEAFKYVRDQQISTFLEEYFYPLQSSIFVNGYEPFVEDEIRQKNHTFVGDHLHIWGRYFVSKTTLRFYPANIFVKILVYLGIWGAIYVLLFLWKIRKDE